MLMPEQGASIAMNVATMAPATSPVYRADAAYPLTMSTTSISANDMPSSAKTAVIPPASPGIVTT